jgi:hypothetical protein
VEAEAAVQEMVLPERFSLHGVLVVRRVLGEFGLSFLEKEKRQNENMVRTEGKIH